MLEAEALNRVVEFDVHAKIIGIELELITFGEAAIDVDVQGEISHPVRI